jgi:glycosyltransferase involved in cell wall biosynthesis
VSQPAVSVIVPCYNGGPFLDGLMACLAAQTLQDFEIIIVDDGSTEAATLHKLEALESRVRVVHQVNSGPAAARNTGIRCSRGTFVLPLDCDDTIEPTFISETLDGLKRTAPDTGFVFTHMRLTGRMEGVLPRHFNRFDQLFLNRLPYCVLFPRSAWEKVGGYDEVIPRGYEDWEFNIRLAKAGYRGIEHAKPLFVYRVSHDGLLMGEASRLHGTRWRYIRDKHPDLYRIPALVRLWRESQSQSPRVSPFAASGLLALAKVLPETWFNELFHRAMLAERSRRASRGEFRIVTQT